MQKSSTEILNPGVSELISSRNKGEIKNEREMFQGREV